MARAITDLCPVSAAAKEHGRGTVQVVSGPPKWSPQVEGMICADCLREKPAANLLRLPDGTLRCPRCQWTRAMDAMARRKP